MPDFSYSNLHGEDVAISSPTMPFTLRELFVHKQLIAVLICMSAVSTLGQPSPRYQPGTITAVTVHQNAPNDEIGDVTRYDVSVI
jgi:hypothetical protein